MKTWVWNSLESVYMSLGIWPSILGHDASVCLIYKKLSNHTPDWFSHFLFLSEVWTFQWLHVFLSILNCQLLKKKKRAVIISISVSHRFNLHFPDGYYIEQLFMCFISYVFFGEVSIQIFCLFFSFFLFYFGGKEESVICVCSVFAVKTYILTVKT